MSNREKRKMKKGAGQKKADKQINARIVDSSNNDNSNPK